MTNVRTWVKKAEIDQRECPGLTSAEREVLTPLRRENRRLENDNETLRPSTPFFAREIR